MICAIFIFRISEKTTRETRASNHVDRRILRAAFALSTDSQNVLTEDERGFTRAHSIRQILKIPRIHDDTIRAMRAARLGTYRRYAC